MKSPNWSKDEDEILKAHYADRGSCWEGWESLLPGRTNNAISNRANSLGLLRKGASRQKKPMKMPSARRTRDPYESYILSCLEDGMTPADIDAKMKWHPGRTVQILTERWERA